MTATATELTAAARAAVLRDQIHDLANHADQLRAQLGPIVVGQTDFTKRRAIADEADATDAEIRRLQAELRPVLQAADAERMAAAERANRLDGARRLLANLQDDVERARGRAGNIGSAVSRDPWTDIVRSVERARAQLRAAGEDVADRVTIEL